MHTTPRGMASSVGSGNNATTTTTTTMPEAAPTLSEREQLKIEFYKTYDVMTGVRIAATLGGFFSLMVLLVVYKSRRRCKSNRQLEDPRLTAAAEAAVAEAEAEERALAAALEALARQQPKPARGPRRSLCVEVVEPRLPLVAPRFASVGGDYDSLLAAPMRYSRSRLTPQRRCSSITCSSTASSYLERRGSAMVMPCLPPAPSYPRHHAAAAYDSESWDYYHPIDIQVIQPTPELSPCGSEAGLYGATAAVLRHQQQLRYSSARRAPLASMGSVDPPEPDSLRSLGSDSVFSPPNAGPPDTEDEVSGFSTDSSDGPVPSGGGGSPPKARRGTGGKLLRLPGGEKRNGRPPAPPDRWDGCVGCVPRRRRRRGSTPPHRHTPPTACMTISASVDAPRSPVLSTTTSSSQNSAGISGLGSPPAAGPYSATTSPIELRYRPQPQPQQQQPRPNSSSQPTTTDWSQETLF